MTHNGLQELTMKKMLDELQNKHTNTHLCLSGKKKKTMQPTNNNNDNN